VGRGRQREKTEKTTLDELDTEREQVIEARKLSNSNY
jgi:hypothetical protein